MGPRAGPVVLLVDDLRGAKGSHELVEIAMDVPHGHNAIHTRPCVLSGQGLADQENRGCGHGEYPHTRRRFQRNKKAMFSFRLRRETVGTNAERQEAVEMYD